MNYLNESFTSLFINNINCSHKTLRTYVCNFDVTRKPHNTEQMNK